MEELRGLVRMSGGPRLMELSLSDFLDVVWAHIVTPPPMADAHEWRETMFIWFYLGHEPRYVTTMNPKTKQKTRKLVPRDQYAKPPPGGDPGRVAESANAQMKRLKERHEQNRGLREAKRRELAAEREQRDPEPKRG